MTTANMQSGLTVKQAAKIYNISERMIYMARKLLRLAPHLADEVEHGRLSLHEALRLATNKPKPTSWDRLWKAWNAATEDDRDRFVVMILKAAGYKE